MSEDQRRLTLKFELPQRLAELPWTGIGWSLHFAWFFLILLVWNCAGNEDASLNTLSVSITTLEIFLVILALGGFWIIRGEVRERVKQETRSLVHEEMHSRVEPQLLRLVEQYLDARSQSGDLREDDVREMMRALDEHDGSDAQRPG